MPLGRLTRRFRKTGRAGPAGIDPSGGPAVRAVYVGNNRLLVGSTIGSLPYAFYVEADDRLLTPWFALSGVHEADVTDYLLRIVGPDSHCIDAGANFGYFTCLMARAAYRGRVLGIEPDAELVGIGRDNLCLNGVNEWASIVSGAVADRDGELTLYRREYRSGNTSLVDVRPELVDMFNEPAAQPFTVSSHSIDTLAERLDGRVDMMKIDVEGAEPLVFAGAARTIARNPGIVIVMEWSPGQIAAAGTAVVDFVGRLEAMGLACTMLVDGREVPTPLRALETMPYRSAVILRHGSRAAGAAPA